DVMGLFIDRESRTALERAYRRFVPRARTFEDTVHRSKLDVMGSTLSNELFRLAYELDRISEDDYHTRDFTLDGLREALREVVAAFDRYRTYLPYDVDQARDVVSHAVHKARQRNPATEPTVYQFIERVIMGEVREDLLPRQRAFVGRFQQYTAPVAAKGVEDTAFYRFFLLSALNEVGGEADSVGQTRHAFHSRARFRAMRYPNSLLPTATHDHKRGEDTRMRLAVLSEIPDEWEEVAAQLSQLSERHKTDQGPARSEQYLFLQTLVALWHGADHETLPDRLCEYALKVARERKLRTSWIHQNEQYERSLEEFVRRTTSDEAVAAVVAPFSEKLARHGFLNAIGETIVKYTTPGVPDIYQGTELLDLSLVDPDNRRPVDYDGRDHVLDAIEQDVSFSEWADSFDERAKLLLVARLLRLRRERAGLFAGAYLPIEPAGEDENQYVAFARLEEEGPDALIVIVSRFSTRWSDRPNATFPLEDDRLRGPFTDLLSAERLELNDKLETASLPLRWAVLVRE
ncbi:MAG TPA: hypothetical protein VF190_00925, partial [Rhodothermales bacterium]